MYNMSHDNRRATQDIDFDFIQYFLLDESIRLFLTQKSNCFFEQYEEYDSESLKRLKNLQDSYRTLHGE